MDDWKYEPARDLGMSFCRRWRSLSRETGLAGAVMQFGAVSLVKAYLAVYHRFRIVGRENLPHAASYIMAANHASHLDAMCLSAAVPIQRRPSVMPIAAGDLFFRTPPRALLSALTINALPMWRDNCGRHALNELRRRLHDQPTIYIFFPEGTRSRTGCMNRLKAGIGMLTAASDIPVVPCHLSGCYAALPPHRRLPRPHRIILTIGQPMTFADMANDRGGWDRIAMAVGEAITQLECGD
jgi:1-acyl-sn-glycerol-3-phosphate acyltransferase